MNRCCTHKADAVSKETLSDEPKSLIFRHFPKIGVSRGDCAHFTKKQQFRSSVADLWLKNTWVFNRIFEKFLQSFANFGKNVRF